MPYVALLKEGDNYKRVDISLEKNLQDYFGNEFLCQLCQEPMILKAGLVRRPHFAHKAQCSSDYEHHPESPMHRASKLALMKNLPQLFSEFTRATPMQEVVMPEIKRVADVVFVFPNGWRMVHEVQLSWTNPRELEKRTRDYESIGCDVIWWLGRDALTKENREWAINHQEACFEIYIDESEETERVTLFDEGIDTFGSKL